MEPHMAPQVSPHGATHRPAGEPTLITVEEFTSQGNDTNLVSINSARDFVVSRKLNHSHLH